jgi:ribosomal-protein-alanine N-acetyltransferase
MWNFSKKRDNAEIGYELHTKFQRLGLMNEVLKATIEFGFSKVGLVEIDAYTDKENVGSIKLLQKNNFAQNNSRSDQNHPNNVIFTLTSNIWRSGQSGFLRK